MVYKIIVHKIIWVTSYILVSIVRFKNRKVQFFGNDLRNIHAPVIFIANHKSPIDPWIIFSSLPFKVFLKVLPMRIFASTEISNHSLVKMLSRLGIVKLVYFLYGCITVPDTGSVSQKIDPLVKVIHSNQSVLFFPEGTLVRGLEIGRIRSGTAFLLQETKGVDIVFCTVRYSKDLSRIRKKAIVNFSLEEFDFSGNILENIHMRLSDLVKL